MSSRAKKRACLKDKRLAVFPVTGRGLAVARRLERRAGAFFDKGLSVYEPEGLKDGGLKREARGAFKAFDCLVFIGAVGIAVRTVAPLIKDKETDPAVVVIDEAGGFVISLLSGHLGGANDIAREMARFLKAVPVITTATDTAGLPCVEDIATRFNMAVEDAAGIKAVNSAILEGGGVMVADEDGARLRAIKKAFNSPSGVFVFSGRPVVLPGIRAYILISSKAAVKPPAGVPPSRALVLRPREFTAGIGCKRGAGAAEVDRAVATAFKEAGLSTLCIRNLATIDIKRDEKGLLAYAKRNSLPVEFFRCDELDKVRPPSGASERVFKYTGAAGVSEPAALLSSGAKRLWIKKRVVGKVTVAAAKARCTW